MTGDLRIGISADGRSVAEAELDGDDPAALVAEARERGAEVIWLEAEADLSSLGFTPARGYARLHAEAVPAGAPLAALAPVDYGTTLALAYLGLWGHKAVAPDAPPPAGATIVGLYRGAKPIGLCRVFPVERRIDGPGVVPGHRVTGNYVLLLRGACAVLGDGPADLETWGESAEVIGAYLELGFALVEETRAWALEVPTLKR